MQTTITLPEYPPCAHTREARALLSKRIPELPPELFNHSTDGGLLNSVSPFRFSYYSKGRSDFAITAIGYHATATLIGCYARIIREFPACAMNTQNCFVLQKPYLSQFRSCAMVLSNSKRNKLAAKRIFREGAPLSDFVGYAKKELLRGIEAQLLMIDESMPDDLIIGDIVIDSPNSTVIGEQSRKLIADVTFRSNYFFQGTWHLGHMTNLGHGRVYHVRS